MGATTASLQDNKTARHKVNRERPRPRQGQKAKEKRQDYYQQGRGGGGILRGLRRGRRRMFQLSPHRWLFCHITSFIQHQDVQKMDGCFPPPFCSLETKRHIQKQKQKMKTQTKAATETKTMKKSKTKGYDES